MGEGGGFPAATRAVAEWFPTKERATAMGIINAGTAVGAVIAPPLIALILSLCDWRWIFVITGGLGLLWTLWWMLSYSSPERIRPRVTIGQDSSSSVCDSNASLRWIDLLRIRESWGLVSAKFLSDAAWYFYLFWLPKYLYDARGFDVKAVGAFAWIPYAAAGVGCLLGGWFSSYLVRRQFSLGVARKLALGLSAAVMPLDHLGSLRSGVLGDCHIQSRIFRTAVLVNAGHGSAHRPVSCQAWSVRSPGWWASAERWAESRSGSWWAICSITDSAMASYSALAGTFHVVAFVIIHAHRSCGSAAESGRKLSYPRSTMKITEIRTRVVRWRGKTVPLPPHFCTNPMDLLNLPEASMQTFTFHGWLVVEIFTDDGHVGIGNAALAPQVTKQVIDLLSEATVDRQRSVGHRVPVATHVSQDDGVRPQGHRHGRDQRGRYCAVGHSGQIGEAAGLSVAGRQDKAANSCLCQPAVQRRVERTCCRGEALQS